MNSRNMPVIMLICVMCLAVFGGVFWYFGMGKYLRLLGFDSRPEPEPGVVHVPLPVPPMDQTTYEVEIAIVEATFAAKKAAGGGASGKSSPDIEYTDDPSRWDIKRRDKKSKTLELE